jgi:hypothetical protein
MDTKTPLQSTTIISAVVGLLAYYFFNFTDISITEAELSELATHIFVLGTLAYNIYGRWKASGPIELFKSSTIKVDLEKLTTDEKALYLKLTEKGK